MEVWKEKLVKICLVIINLTLVIKLLLECFKIEEFNYTFVGLLIVLGIIIYLFFSLILNSIKKRVVFLILLCAIGGIIIYKTSGVLVSEEIKIISLNLKNINQAALHEKNINFEEFVHIFSLTIPLITPLFIGITQKWNVTPLIFTSSIFILFWYQIFYKAVIGNIPYFITVLIFTLGINEYIKKNKEYRGREVKVSLKSIQVVLVIVIIAAIVPRIILVFPQEYKGKTINGMREYFRNEFAEGKGDSKNPIADAIQGSYGLKQSGYSDSRSILGGRISINHNEVFKVTSDMPYYLRGRVSDCYTGKSWLKYDDSLGEINGDNVEGGLKKLQQTIGDEEFSSVEKLISVFPSKNFKSTSFFTPNGSKNINGANNERIFVDKVPTFMSNEEIEDYYQVTYLSYGDYDNYLQGIQYSQYKKIPYDEEYTLPIKEFGQSDEEYLLNLYSLVNNYKGEESINLVSSRFNSFKMNYEEYIKTDSPINNEVYTIVNNILNDEAEKKEVKVEELTNHEKALSIRNYLMDNYEYVTNVKSNNQYNDFVSNFLLEEKQGYCTYFATATVMMCRIAGVPARYVEGFKMSDSKDEDGNYRVTNADAHAWAEILVNSYRDHWAVVDSAPTPREYEESIIKKQVNTEESSEETTNNDMEINKLDKNTSGYEEDDFGGDRPRISSKLLSLYIVIGILMIAILSFIIMFWINRRKIVKSKSIIPLYNYYLERLKTLGIIKKTSEGDLEFVHTIKCKELKNWLYIIVEQSYDEFYGGTVVEGIDKKQYLKYIEKYIRDKDKWYRYIVKKYFLLRWGGY